LIRSDILRKLIWILCGILVLLMPVRAEAAGVGDVYAALRDIGVPEEYVSQAAGVLARGTSDGAGVYRSDGSYYAYSDMVGYIYANRETILAFCGVGAETASAETAVSGSGAVTGTSDSFLTSDTSAVTTVTTTLTTASVTTTVAATTANTTESTEDTVSVNQETEPHSGISAATAVVCIVLGLGGFAGIVLRLRGQERSQSTEQ